MSWVSFFFSSRRRHTISKRDWSSDVCSSDLAASRPRLQRWLDALDRGFREHGAYYVLLLRLTPVFPFWVLNLGLGLTPVRLRDYWWASQLGMLPATAVIVNAGASLAEITTFR